MGEAKRRKQLDKGFGVTTEVKEVFVFPVFRSELNQSFEDEIKEKMEAKRPDRDVLFFMRGASGQVCKEGGIADVVKLWIETNVSPEVVDLFFFPQSDLDEEVDSDSSESLIIDKYLEQIKGKQKRQPKFVVMVDQKRYPV